MRILRVLPAVVVMAATSSQAGAEGAATPGSLADICPSPDARDTVDSVRSSIAARLGKPLKEEAVGEQYVLTFRQKDGSQLFVILTRDNGKLEANCYASKS